MIGRTKGESIAQALADGTLIDVADTAKSLGFDLPEFITPHLSWIVYEPDQKPIQTDQKPRPLEVIKRTTTTNAARKVEFKTSESGKIKIRVFMTPAVWEKSFERSKAKLVHELEDLWMIYFGDENRYGPLEWKTCTSTLEIDEEFGRVMVLTMSGEDHLLGIKHLTHEQTVWLT